MSLPTTKEQLLKNLSVTEKETIVLSWMLRGELKGTGGYCHDDLAIFTGLRTTQLAGVLSSLARKGLVQSIEYEGWPRAWQVTITGKFAIGAEEAAMYTYQEESFKQEAAEWHEQTVSLPDR